MDKMVKSGDIFEGCEIIGENEYYLFLINPEKIIYFNSWYDIVLDKDETTKDLKIGDNVDVQVYTIHIAEDGTPGAFVKFIKKT